MKLSTSVQTAALLAVLAAIPLPSVACRAAGPNTHVGKVLSVDKSAGTFTLLDAETMSAVTLSADAAFLDRVSGMSGSVVVTYEKSGDTLRALKLK